MVVTKKKSVKVEMDSSLYIPVKRFVLKNPIDYPTIKSVVSKAVRALITGK
jgi:hypothetical protein